MASSFSTSRDYTKTAFALGSARTRSASLGLQQPVAGPTPVSPAGVSPGAAALKFAHAVTSGLTNRRVDANNAAVAQQQQERVDSDRAAAAQARIDAADPVKITERAKATRTGQISAEAADDPIVPVPGHIRQAVPGLPDSDRASRVKTYDALYRTDPMKELRPLSKMEMSDYGKFLNPEQSARASTTGLSRREIEDAQKSATTHRTLITPFAGAGGGSGGSQKITPEQRTALVDRIYSGKAPPPSMQTRTGDQQALLGELFVKHPDFDLTKATQQWDNAKGFYRSANGQQFVRMRMAASTVAQHIAQYEKLYKESSQKLGLTGNIPANASLNWIVEHLSGDERNSAQAQLAGLAMNREFLTNELAVLLGGGQSSDKSRAEARATLNKNFSMNTTAGALASGKQLLLGRLSAYQAMLPFAGGKDNPYLIKTTPMVVFGKTLTGDYSDLEDDNGLLNQAGVDATSGTPVDRWIRDADGNYVREGEAAR